MFCLKARDFRTFAQVYDGAPWRSITPICCFVLRRGVRGEWETSKWRWNLGVYYLKVVGGMRQPYEHEKRPSQRVSVKAESKSYDFSMTHLRFVDKSLDFFLLFWRIGLSPKLNPWPGFEDSDRVGDWIIGGVVCLYSSRLTSRLVKVSCGSISSRLCINGCKVFFFVSSLKVSFFFFFLQFSSYLDFRFYFMVLAKKQRFIFIFNPQSTKRFYICLSTALWSIGSGRTLDTNTFRVRFSWWEN